MARMKKVQRKLPEAIIDARDDALIEIGREATERKEARAGKARRRAVGKVAVAVSAPATRSDRPEVARV